MAVVEGDIGTTSARRRHKGGSKISLETRSEAGESKLGVELVVGGPSLSEGDTRDLVGELSLEATANGTGGGRLSVGGEDLQKKLVDE